jgi:5-methyltetrahydrofolate--homocysteine methyltransferase
MSALLTTTMLAMKRTIDAIREAGLRDQVKIMVGGAPLSAEYAKQIGADGYASNAATAAEMAKSFVG